MTTEEERRKAAAERLGGPLPLGIPRRPDGTPAIEVSQAEVEREDFVRAAWNRWYESGDRSLLVQAGILPDG